MPSRPVARTRPEGGESATPRRADAERNIEKILRTATDLLAANPGVSMVEVARSAGVGRVTLYSHFPSRAELIEAVVARVVTEADAALASANLDDLDPGDALHTLITTSWQVLDRFNRLRVAAQDEIGEKRLRALHDHFGHLERVLVRGQEAGVFRSDLTLPWLVQAGYALMHAAGDLVESGEIAAGDVPDLMARTMLPMLRADRAQMA